MISKGQTLNLNIEKLAFGGLGIAYSNGIVVFVKGALPGEKVTAKIYKKKKNYLEAYVTKKINSSKDEINPICNYFGICGGCTFQNYDYQSQLKQKYNQVGELFNKMVRINIPHINPIIGCKNEFYYRNKMEFSYSYNKWILNPNSSLKDGSPALGLHVKSRFDKIVDIDDCSIQGKISSNVFSFIKKHLLKHKTPAFNMKLRTGYLKNIVIREARETNQVLVNFITINDDTSPLVELSKSLKKNFSEIQGIVNTIVKPNSGSLIGDQEIILFGEDYIEEIIGEYSFKVSTNSFFQTNSEQAKILYEQIIKLSQLKGNEIVYDLYCGTGSIGIYLSKYVKKIYGIEIVMSAVMDAIENAKKNHIKNINFFHGDLVDFFTSNQEINLIEPPDVVILDPPRAGIHKNTLNDITKLNAKKIIYISCNPSTQVRDINILIENGYSIQKIQPVDMFPHTPHIENIVSLST